MRGTQEQVLKAEPHHFTIHNQLLGVFYYYFKDQVSKKVSFFSPAFAGCFKKGINAAVQVIAECVTARWIYTHNYPKSTQPSRLTHAKSLLAGKLLAWMLHFHMQSH